MKLRAFVIGALLLGPSLASADAPRRQIETASNVQMFGFEGELRTDGRVMARQMLPAQTQPDGTIAAVAQSKIIYLNKNGVTLSPAQVNDARTNKSTIASQLTQIQPWNVSATDWQSTVSCMRDLFARFDVQVVDTDPGNVPHIEAVFGGAPGQVGMDQNVAGVSPFTTDCSIIENSIVFTFTGAFQFTPREACEIMAQEVAHSYGLDHELLASDPMTYLQYNGNRAFQDQAASCGENVQRPCGIGGSTCRANQNSVTLLKERLGTADAIAPDMQWATPSDNATVPPGFEVRASGTDNLAVTGATLKIDGVQVDSQTGAGPFTFTTSTSIAEGQHTVVVELSDGKNYKSETRTVTVKKGAPPDTGTGSTGEPGSDQEALDNGDLVGGCSAGGGHAGALLALGLVGLVSLRRKRR
jgi:MYXO-CTERM domain-containing protein